MMLLSANAQEVDTVPPIKVGVVLPFYSEQFQSAAMAVEAGILAAQQITATDNISLQIYKTTDQIEEAAQIYDEAAKHSDYVIGPLQRDQVKKLMDMPEIMTPTIALAVPSADRYGSLTKPNLLMTGVSLEEEARQIALWMEDSLIEGSVLVVATDEVWQQRVARAFEYQAKQNGFMVVIHTIPVKDNRLNRQALKETVQLIKQEKPAALMLALDRIQASQFSIGVLPTMPVWGTSALNPFMNAQQKTTRYPELNGIRLLDIPWQVYPNSDIVKRFPVPQGYWQMKPTSDQRRLYALGIDAYQIVRELALQQSQTEIVGVTGKLTINLGLGGVTYFQRHYEKAVYQHGMVVPYDETDNSLD